MSVSVGSASNHKFPANCDAHLSESNFQTRSTASKAAVNGKRFKKRRYHFTAAFVFSAPGSACF